MSTNKPMPQIFLSYRWSNSDIADGIDNDFKAVGITFLRDVRDVGYRGSIKAFMNRVGKSDFIVMLISDEYLRSINCMYEVMELLNSHEFEKRILPVKLESAKPAFNDKDRMQYYEYWKKEMEEAKARLTEHSNEDTLELHKRCKTIYDRMGEFLKKLTDLNVLPYETLKLQNYKPILDILGVKDEAILTEAISIQNINDIEERDIAVEDFVSKYPNNKFSLSLKAFIAHENKQFKKARKYYETLVNIYSDFALAYYNLAILLGEHFQDYSTAKLHYEKAIDINPNYAEAHNNLGGLLKNHFNDYSSAKQRYKKAIAINENYAEAYNNLALLLQIHFNNYSTSKKLFEKATAINPNFAEAYFNLANLLQNHFNDYDTSKKLFEKAIAINPNFINAYNNLAILLTNQFNDNSTAKKLFEKAIAINPNDYDAHYNLAILLTNHFNDYSTAKQLYEKAIAINPNYAEVYYNLAIIITNHFNDYSTAKQLYEKAIAVNPKFALAHSNLCILLFEKFEDEVGAKKHYSISTDLDSSLIIDLLDDCFEIKR